MKKFQFRLQPYLKICLHREEAEWLRLQELLNEFKQLERVRDQLAAERQNTIREHRAQKVLLVYEAEWFVRRIDFLEQQIASAHMRVVEAETKVSVQRDRLIAARRRRKVVEKLRERRLHQYEAEAAKTLQNEMDDIHLQLQSRAVGDPN